VQETEIAPNINAPELTVLGKDTVADINIDILLSMEQEEKKDEKVNELDKTSMEKQSIESYELTRVNQSCINADVEV